MSITNQFINVNDQLYLVKRVVREESVKNVDAAKEVLYSEHVFRKDGFLYFCDIIHDLEPEKQEDEQTETNPEERVCDPKTD
jgi:ERCC4-type nuclease